MLTYSHFTIGILVYWCSNSPVLSVRTVSFILDCINIHHVQFPVQQPVTRTTAYWYGTLKLTVSLNGSLFVITPNLSLGSLANVPCLHYGFSSCLIFNEADYFYVLIIIPSIFDMRFADESYYESTHFEHNKEEETSSPMLWDPRQSNSNVRFLGVLYSRVNAFHIPIPWLKIHYTNSFVPLSFSIISLSLNGLLPFFWWSMNVLVATDSEGTAHTVRTPNVSNARIVWPIHMTWQSRVDFGHYCDFRGISA